MTIADFREYLAAARAERVQEFSIGDTHVLFSGAAMVQAALVGRGAQADAAAEVAEPAPVSADDAEELLKDPDLFLHVDGPADVVSQ